MNGTIPCYSVGQVSRYIKNLFSGDFLLRRICVEGEISNLKYHPSGHIYFTMKDADGVLNAVLFASHAMNLKVRLQNGLKIRAYGSISVYEKGGSYQLYVNTVEPSGLGELYQKYALLKARFEEAGYFDARYKKAVPKYAFRVGVVTAKSGAALQDIISITKRRNPFTQLVLYPAYVQGERAAKDIAHGIAVLDKMGLDVIIVGRGGGSLEDLWAFNEEAVVRAVFDAETPVISAVGHETDTTLCDYAADLRAPTPSAAAELAVFSLQNYLDSIEGRRQALERIMRRSLAEARLRLDKDRQHLFKFAPESRLNELRQALVYARDDLSRLMNDSLSGAQKQLYSGKERLSDLMHKKLNRSMEQYRLACARLDALSPLKRLAGGYSFVESGDGQPIRRISQVKAGDILKIYVQDGHILARTEETEYDRREE